MASIFWEHFPIKQIVVLKKRLFNQNIHLQILHAFIYFLMKNVSFWKPKLFTLQLLLKTAGEKL